MRASKLLPSGKSNAIPGQTLVELLGLKDQRELTKRIERERRDGFPVCASVAGDRGYYLAADVAELEEYIQSLERRLFHVRRTRDHLESTLLRMTGQSRIGGW